MKRCVWMFIICAILATICILEEITVNNTLNTIKDYSEQLDSLSQNTENVNDENIYKLSVELGDYWNKRELLLCFFINYKDTNEMSNEIVKIISYSKNNVKEEFTTSLALLKYYCKTFNHITGFNLQNIL